MKRFVLIIIILAIVISCGISSKTIKNNDINPLLEYEVFKIDSINDVYLSYLTRNDKLHKVLSLKEKGSDNCNKISVGERYKLSLKSYFEDTPLTSLHINGIEYHGQIIEIEGDSITDLYTSRNLKGLCIADK